MEADTGIALKELMVNGGITSNRFVLQFITDLLDCALVNRGMPDVSALGAAYLAGLKAGIFKSLDELEALNTTPASFIPGTMKDKVAEYHKEWVLRVKQA